MDRKEYRHLAAKYAIDRLASIREEIGGMGSAEWAFENIAEYRKLLDADETVAADRILHRFEAEAMYTVSLAQYVICV